MMAEVKELDDEIIPLLFSPPNKSIGTLGVMRGSAVSTAEDEDVFQGLEVQIGEIIADHDRAAVTTDCGERGVDDLSGGYARSVGGSQTERKPEERKYAAIYSRKVFIGGLPDNTTDLVIRNFFKQFGELSVDWPHRGYTQGSIPPNGFAFILFEDAHSVEKLVAECTKNADQLSIMLKKDELPLKKIEVRPWKLRNQSCICRRSPASFRYAVFIGGLPRDVTASQLANAVYQVFGEVAAVTITVENDTGYPRGAARVVFCTREAYAKAIAAHFMTMQFGNIEKKMEVKPFLMKNMLCEGCHMVTTDHLCAQLPCLLYLCDSCWYRHHAMRSFMHHTPMVKCDSKANVCSNRGAGARTRRFDGCPTEASSLLSPGLLNPSSATDQSGLVISFPPTASVSSTPFFRDQLYPSY